MPKPKVEATQKVIGKCLSVSLGASNDTEAAQVHQKKKLDQAGCALITHDPPAIPKTMPPQG